MESNIFSVSVKLRAIVRAVPNILLTTNTVEIVNPHMTSPLAKWPSKVIRKSNCKKSSENIASTDK